MHATLTPKQQHALEEFWRPTTAPFSIFIDDSSETVDGWMEETPELDEEWDE